MPSISDTIIMGGAKSFSDALDRLGVKYQLYENPGISSSKDRDWIGSATRGSQVPIWDGQRFKLLNGNDLVYEGSGIDGLRQAAAMTGDLGKGWRIISSAPTGVDEFDPALFESGAAGIDYGGQRRSDFGDFLPYALLAAAPFGAAAALGGLGVVGGTTTGAGAGGTAAGAAGATTAATGAAGGLAAGSLAPITVIGAPTAGIGAAGTAGLVGAAGAGTSLAVGGTSGALPSDIVVNGALPSGIDFGGLSAMTSLGSAGANLAVQGAGASASSPTQDIVVEGMKPSSPPIDVLGGISAAQLAAAAGAQLPSTATSADLKATAKGAGSASAIDKIIDGLRIAGLGTGLIGNLFGGGGGSSGDNKVPGGLSGDLNPIFNAELPSNPVIPGVGTADKLGARTMSPQDWYRYGTRPEQSFFNYIPQGYTPPAPGVSDPQWDSLAVKGG